MTVTSRRPWAEITPNIPKLVLERCLIERCEGMHSRAIGLGHDFSAFTPGAPIRFAVDLEPA